MIPEIRPEEIFDAATDDGQFERLSGRLAQMLGARSGVLHWRLNEETEEQEISYSGYFSAENMAQFEGDFAQSDVWANAINRPAALNRIWNLEDLVPRKHYERSRIYNEWIRPIGDDTMHALGTVVHTREMRIELGFHRGRSQTAFDADSVSRLSSYLPSLRRMALVRQRLGTARNGSASVALDTVGHASFTLSAKGNILHLNQGAEALIARANVLRMRNGRLRAVARSQDAALGAMIAKAGGALPTSETLMLLGADERRYSSTVVPAQVGGVRRIVLVVSEVMVHDPTAEGRLRSLYGLTAAEAAVAALLAEGLSPVDIATRRVTEIGTVRTQIKAIAAKLGVGRQSEIVRAVLSLPRLY